MPKIFNQLKIISYGEFSTNNESEALVAGTIMSIQEKKSAKGTPFAIVKFSDNTGEFELFIFSEILINNRDKLNRLKKTLDDAEQFGNEQEKQLARANYDSYANMYRYSAGTTTNTKDEFTIYEMKGVLADKRTPRQVKPEGRGEDYRQQAQDLLAYYSSGENIVDSTEDILDRTKAGQNLRVLAVSSQLGGSIATALINTMSMVTHSIPYLATYNP